MVIGAVTGSEVEVGGGGWEGESNSTEECCKSCTSVSSVRDKSDADRLVVLVLALTPALALALALALGRTLVWL